jgi:D-alanyl-D-alanine carboxypeptidase (penicillin-binding protein 5/6)
MKRYIFVLFLLLFPYSVFAEELIPNATSGILIEASTGKIIYEKDKDKEVSIASMTKMVAQIIILEEIEAKRIRWSDIVTVSHNASSMGGSQIYVEDGEKISVQDLMKGISVASGNDATVAMAEYISGSEEKFVERMNKKVKELGLKHTHFVNCTGLDEDNHYSSAYDMAMIARNLVVNHPDIIRFSSIYEDYLRQNTDKKFWLVNTNKLINQYEGADGLKTGHTDNAGYCLAATAKRDNLRLIGIVLGEKDGKVRNNETIGLLDYGFNSIKLKQLKKKGDSLKKIILPKTDNGVTSAILSEDLNIIEDSSNSSKYTYSVKINKLKYPILKGDIIGKVIVKSNEKNIMTQSLVSSENINKLGLYQLFINNLYNIVFGIF